MMWEVATGAAAFINLYYGGFYDAVVVEGLRPQVPPDMPPDYAAFMQQVGGGWDALCNISIFAALSKLAVCRS
jgi:hypothetical protein